jgi:hypothetical protein
MELGEWDGFGIFWRRMAGEIVTGGDDIQTLP